MRSYLVILLKIWICVRESTCGGGAEVGGEARPPDREPEAPPAPPGPRAHARPREAPSPLSHPTPGSWGVAARAGPSGLRKRPDVPQRAGGVPGGVSHTRRRGHRWAPGVTRRHTQIPRGYEECPASSRARGLCVRSLPPVVGIGVTHPAHSKEEVNHGGCCPWPLSPRAGTHPWAVSLELQTGRTDQALTQVQMLRWEGARGPGQEHGLRGQGRRVGLGYSGDTWWGSWPGGQSCDSHSVCAGGWGLHRQLSQHPHRWLGRGGAARRGARPHAPQKPYPRGSKAPGGARPRAPRKPYPTFSIRRICLACFQEVETKVSHVRKSE